MSVNFVVLHGKIGRDAETRHTGSGKSVTSFSLATDSFYKGDKTTEWHDVVVWEMEGVVPYLKKGQEVVVVGRIQTRSWEGQDGQKKYRTEVVARELSLAGKAEDGGRKNAKSASRGRGNDNLGVGDDDVPF